MLFPWHSHAPLQSVFFAVFSPQLCALVLLRKCYSLAVVIHLIVEDDWLELCHVVYLTVVVSQLRSVPCNSWYTWKFIVDVSRRGNAGSERYIHIFHPNFESLNNELTSFLGGSIFLTIKCISEVLKKKLPTWIRMKSP